MDRAIERLAFGIGWLCGRFTGIGERRWRDDRARWQEWHIR
jgi:hypothetical protein